MLLTNGQGSIFIRFMGFIYHKIISQHFFISLVFITVFTKGKNTFLLKLTGDKMAKYNDELEIEIDDAQQRKTWVIERVAWVIFLIFLLAGFAGFFGRGGVSKRTIGSENEGMKVEYEKFLRYHTEEQLRVTVYRKIQDKMLGIWISADFSKKVQIGEISPEPEKVEFEKNGTVYYFNVANGAEPKQVTFYIKPEQNGNINATIKDMEGTSFSISQFIFP
jgi:hypothetical protein